MGRDRTPGDLLLHPVALASLVVVIVNDRVLKVHYPSSLSGKLSDFAGLVFFPLFAVSAVEGVRWLRRRDCWQLSSRAVDVAVAVVGLAFILIKTWHPAGEVYRDVLGLALWPVDALTALAGGRDVPALGRALLVEDRTDLVAVVILALPLWVGRSCMASPHERQRESHDLTAP